MVALISHSFARLEPGFEPQSPALPRMARLHRIRQPPRFADGGEGEMRSWPAGKSSDSEWAEWQGRATIADGASRSGATTGWARAASSSPVAWSGLTTLSMPDFRSFPADGALPNESCDLSRSHVPHDRAVNLAEIWFQNLSRYLRSCWQFLPRLPRTSHHLRDPGQYSPAVFDSVHIREFLLGPCTLIEAPAST